MSLLSKTLLAAGLAVAIGGSAYAEGDGPGPWVLSSTMGYSVDMSGKTTIVELGSVDKVMMAKAKAVPRGTVFFMKDGALMMSESISH
jgi:hypothetical protein